MQGSIDQTNPSLTAFDSLKESYENRPNINEMFILDRFSLPSNFNHATERFKKNFSKFAFFYIAFLSIIALFFVIFNRFMIIPISMAIFCIQFFYEPYKFKGFEITRTQAAITCIIINLLICFFFSSIASVFVNFFALSAFSIGIEFFHGSIYDPEISEKTNDQV